MARACALENCSLEIYDTIANAKSAANWVIRVEALGSTCSASFGQWKPPTHHLQLQEAQSCMFMGFACFSLELACCQATPLLFQTLVSRNTFESKATILPSVAKPSAQSHNQCNAMLVPSKLMDHIHRLLVCSQAAAPSSVRIRVIVLSQP